LEKIGNLGSDGGNFAECIGIARGTNAGYKTEVRELKPRIGRSKGRLSKRTTFVREIIKEVAGYVDPGFGRKCGAGGGLERMGGRDFSLIGKGNTDGF